MYLFIKLSTAFLLLFPILTWGQDDYKVDPETSQAIPNFAGRVKLLKGKNTFYRKNKNGKEERLKPGTRVKKDYVIYTGEASFVRIELEDETVVNIGPNSKFILADWQFKGKDNRKVLINFLAGKIRANFKRKGKPGDLKVKTPTSSMGIRGTIVLGNISSFGKKMVTELALLSGKAIVTNKFTNKKYKLKKLDHYIQFANDSNGLLDEGMRVLSDSTYDYLKSNEVKDKFLPFLDYFNGELSSSGRTPSSVPDEYGVNKRTPSTLKVKKSNWKDNLNKLNEALQDYNSY